MTLAEPIELKGLAVQSTVYNRPEMQCNTMTGTSTIKGLETVLTL